MIATEALLRECHDRVAVLKQALAELDAGGDAANKIKLAAFEHFLAKPEAEQHRLITLFHTKLAEVAAADDGGA